MESSQQASEQEQAPDQFESEQVSSTRWTTSTKRLIVTILVVLALLVLYRVRSLLIPVIMSIVIAYLLLAPVRFLNQRTRLSRNVSIAIIYLLIITILIAIPATTIPPLISQANNLIENTPQYLEQFGQLLEDPVVIAGFTIPLDELQLDTLYVDLSSNLVDIVQAVVPQGFSIFGRFATATLSTLGWVALVLIFSFYMVKDYKVLWGSVLSLAPEDYQSDLQRLAAEVSDIWNAFLRGQLILGLIIGTVTAVSLFLLGVPNALLIGLLTGLLEFIPNIGPVIAAIPAVLIALFQTESSWLGSLVGPFWFALIVLLVLAIIQRVENMYLVPRIIGRRLKLHPLVVLIGAVAGASIAGIFGILLAAPLLSTARLILLYIYRKLLNQPAFQDIDGSK